MAIWGSWPTGKPGGTIGSHQKGVISRESNSIAMKSRVMGDCQARFRERLEVQFLRPTRQPEDWDQPASRESQALLSGAAEGIVVPMKPGKATFINKGSN